MTIGTRPDQALSARKDALRPHADPASADDGRLEQAAFTLVDPSIVDAHGHYLEYAERVLLAAAGAGFQCVLGANRSFRRSDDDASYRTETAFTDSFWSANRPRPSAGILFLVRQGVRGLRARLSAAVWSARFNLRFSRFGLARLRARELGLGAPELLDMSADADAATATNPQLVSFFVLLTRVENIVARLIAGVRRRAARLPRRVKRGLRLAMTAAGWGLRTLLLAIAAVLLAPFLLIAALVARIVIRAPSADARLSQELRQFIRAAKLKPADVIFLPTVGPAELRAIIRLTQRDAVARRLKWRLMFRRPVFTGSRESYERESDTPNVRHARLLHVKTARALRGVNARFFTDTDPLTEQYNRLGSLRFATAPIPIAGAIAPAPPRDASTALTIGYLGDARDEKGFGLLPALVDEFSGQGLAPAKVRFLVQANYNIPGGEPRSAAARLALEATGGDVVELAAGPFDPPSYKALVERMHVVLAPYDGVAYSARSSSVFLEAIMSGRPVICTEGTWMARLIEPSRQAYYASLHERLGPSEQNVTENRAGALRVRMSGAGRIVRVTLSFNSARPDYVAIVRATAKDARGAVVSRRSQAVFVIEPSVHTLFEIPADASLIEISIGARDASSVVPPTAISAAVFSASTAPIGFGAVVTAARSEDLSYALRNIVTHFPDYRKAVDSIGSSLAAYHTAESLVHAMAAS